MKLTDILKEAGIEMGKIYTDKDRPPFQVNEKTSAKVVKKTFKVGGEVLKNTKVFYPEFSKEPVVNYHIKGFEEPISKKMLLHIKKELGGDYILKTNAGVELHSKEVKNNKWKGIKVLRQEGINEASDKIQVQGLGVYDYKSLSSKVERMVKDLLKRNKKGNHTGLGKNQLNMLGAMWDALAKYEEKK
jgi:hypothetical protein